MRHSILGSTNWGFRAQRFYLNLLPVLGFYTIRQISTSPTSLWRQFF